jgi:1,4-dihydroxy-6-naphthoate synthase
MEIWQIHQGTEQLPFKTVEKPVYPEIRKILKLSIGYSPCPNDTFIFEALINGKIDTNGLTFDPVLEDVETLNAWAKEGRLDITKLSFPALFNAEEHYDLLEAGAALGKGVGPLLVSRDERVFSVKEIEEASIAIPGWNTTANLLLDFAFPNAKNRSAMIFSAIEDAVLNGKCELGVIIHENRFTYREKGLNCQLDLGEYWEEKMKVPIPLGGIAIQRSKGEKLKQQVEDLIRQSVDYAFANYPLISPYVKEHSQTLSEEVMRKHIELYVNEYTKSLGVEGRKAINVLRKVQKGRRAEKDR